MRIDAPLLLLCYIAALVSLIAFGVLPD